MTDLFQALATNAAAAAAAVSIIATLQSLIFAWRERRRKIKKSEADDFEAILRSDDIEKLGEYLDESIGQFDVSEYAQSDDVSSRIDRYVTKLKEHIGTDEEITEEEAIKAPKEERPDSPVVLSDSFQPPYDKVFDELTTGERWNALARLRRHIEIELRHIGQELGFKDRQMRSAGQIIHVLATNENVNQNAADHLRYAISVCNRAVHGQEVTEGEALEALWVAQKAMQSLVSGSAPSI